MSKSHCLTALNKSGDRIDRLAKGVTDQPEHVDHPIDPIAMPVDRALPDEARRHRRYIGGVTPSLPIPTNLAPRAMPRRQRSPPDSSCTIYCRGRQPICPMSIRSAEIESLRAASQLHSQLPAKAVRQRNGAS